MYKLLIRPTAYQDMHDIVQYIDKELYNPAAAARLIKEWDEKSRTIALFPFACPVHRPRMKLKHEYHKALVRSYAIYYWVDENSNTVVISRVISTRRGKVDQQLLQD